MELSGEHRSWIFPLRNLKKKCLPPGTKSRWSHKCLWTHSIRIPEIRDCMQEKEMPGAATAEQKKNKGKEKEAVALTQLVCSLYFILHSLLFPGYTETINTGSCFSGLCHT